MSAPELKTKLIIAESDDPWFNLAAEEVLFNRLQPGEAALYLWVNSASVIIGRYQNPWLECRLGQMKDDGVKLARRMSGGGAVYHDPGNLNFSFMAGAEIYDKQTDFSIILQALGNLGISAGLNSRNDIIVDGNKVSGSAFKLTKTKSVHHCTLLVSSDLDRLRTYLRPGTAAIESKGIKSVRSEVANLADCLPGLTFDDVKQAAAQSFFKEFGGGPTEYLSESAAEADEELTAKIEQHRSPEWLFGKCPEFTHSFSGDFSWGRGEAVLGIRNAEIFDSAVIINGNTKTENVISLSFQQGLAGVPYFRKPVAEALNAILGNSAEQGGLVSEVIADLNGLILSEIPDF